MLVKFAEVAEFPVLALVTVQAPELTDSSILYPIIALPPLFVGALQESATPLMMPVAEMPVGASGIDIGLAAITADAPCPAELVAETRK